VVDFAVCLVAIGHVCFFPPYIFLTFALCWNLKVIPELRARIQKNNANNILARKEANEKKEQEKRKKKKVIFANKLFAFSLFFILVANGSLSLQSLLSLQISCR